MPSAGGRGEGEPGTGSRGRLLDAGLELFSRRGYAETSVSEVARAAGVSKGLVYYYFDAKRDLLEAVMRRGEERLEATLRRQEAGPGTSAVPALVMEVLGLVAEDLRYWRLRFALRARPELREELDLPRWSRPLESAIERSLRRAGVEEASTEARALAAAVDGAAQHYVLDPAGYPLVDVAEAIVARYLPAD